MAVIRVSKGCSPRYLWCFFSCLSSWTGHTHPDWPYLWGFFFQPCSASIFWWSNPFNWGSCRLAGETHLTCQASLFLPGHCFGLRSPWVPASGTVSLQGLCLSLLFYWQSECAKKTHFARRHSLWLFPSWPGLYGALDCLARWPWMSAAATWSCGRRCQGSCWGPGETNCWRPPPLAKLTSSLQPLLLTNQNLLHTFN